MSAKVVRVLVKAGLVAAGAAIFGLALSSSVSAEEAAAEQPSAASSPSSAATHPASMKMLAGDGPPAVPQWLSQGSEVAEALAVEEAAALEEEAAAGEAAESAVPASEPVLRAAPPHLARHPAEAPSALERAFGTLRTGSEEIGSFLGRVLSACQVGFGSGAGGPVLLLGVLGLAVALARHRVLGTRWVPDEDVPRFLYAWELTPPG